MIFHKHSFSYIIIIILCILIGSFWLTNIDTIGLHGDEAWFGLKALKYNETGIDRLYGLNYITGILQSVISSISFNILGVGVVQLRLPGILINLLGLGLLVGYLLFRKQLRIVLFLLLFSAQSTLLLVYSKIAWEVCSFNLFFEVVTIISLLEFIRNRNLEFWGFIYLSTTFLGVYNHILFASLPSSILLGYLFWIAFNKNEKPDNLNFALFIVLSIGVINISITFFVMHYLIDWLWVKVYYLCFIIPFLLIGIQSLLINLISNKTATTISLLIDKFMPSKVAIKVFLYISVIAFLFFHGASLFQVFSHYTLFNHLYSYTLTLLVKGIFSMVSVVLILFFLYHLWLDLKKETASPWAFILVTYLGIFCVFTTSFPHRYFLLVNVLILLYLSLKFSTLNFYQPWILPLILLGYVFFVQLLLWRVSSDNDRVWIPRYFRVSNNRRETSAHFLPFKKVIHFVKEHKIGKVLTDEPFFIGNNFSLYKKIYPEIQNYKNTMELNHDYNPMGDGFEIVVMDRE